MKSLLEFVFMYSQCLLDTCKYLAWVILNIFKLSFNSKTYFVVILAELIFGYFHLFGWFFHTIVVASLYQYSEEFIWWVSWILLWPSEIISDTKNKRLRFLTIRWFINNWILSILFMHSSQSILACAVSVFMIILLLFPSCILFSWVILSSWFIFPGVQKLFWLSILDSITIFIVGCQNNGLNKILSGLFPIIMHAPGIHISDHVIPRHFRFLVYSSFPFLFVLSKIIFFS